MTDASYTRQMAETVLAVSPNELSIDDLACRLSRKEDGPVSVRNIGMKSLDHSAVYVHGERQHQKAYLALSFLERKAFVAGMAS